MVATLGALIVWAPYATLRVGFERALRLQALAILAATSLLLLWGLLRGPEGGRAERLARWRAMLSSTPRRPALGVALYLGAAMLGAVVGWISGHPPARVAAQTLSMGLLPLAAVAGFALVRPATAETKSPLEALAPTLVVAATLAAVAHLLHAVWRLALGVPAGRLYFTNSVSIAGVSLLALLLALALARGGRVSRYGWWLAATVLATYMLGTGIRGLLLLTPPAILVFLACADPKLRWRRSVAVLAVCVVLLLVGAEALWRWDTAPRRSLVPGRGTAHLLELEEADEKKPDEKPRRLLPAGLELEPAPWRGGQFRRALSWSSSLDGEVIRLPRTLPIDRPGLYRLVAHLGSRGIDRGSYARGCVTLWWLDAARAKLGELGVCAPAGPGWHERAATGVVPPGTTQARVVFGVEGADPAAAGGRWRLQRLRLERLGEARSGRVLEQLAFVAERARSTLDPFAFGSGTMRRSASFRLEESRALLTRFVRASPARKLFGHGLGASYSLARFAGEAPSPRLDTRDLHYVHNFYLFLLFKLGLVGTLAVLAAFAAWLSWLLAATRAAAPGRSRALLAALFAAWLAYAAWSVVSPEILNFRLAPIWGLTLALGAALARGAEAGR